MLPGTPNAPKRPDRPGTTQPSERSDLPAIPKEPALPTLLDFEALRREGLALIEGLGSDLWTDYNAHDPGVTLLEALCFGLTDLGYRLTSPMRDLLAPPPGEAAPEARDGPLFSARAILPTHPVTELDYRKLLVDLDGIRNAWVVPAEAAFGAEPREEPLDASPSDPAARPVTPRGVYSVLVDLADDPRLGSLNDTTWPWSPKPGGEPPLPLEVVFPPWDAWRRMEDGEPVLEWEDPWLAEVDPVGFAVSDVEVVDDASLAARVRVDVPFEDAVVSRTVEVRVLLRTARRGSIADWTQFVTDALERLEDGAPVEAMRRRLRRAFDVARRVVSVLQAHRNLCEDFEEPSSVRFEEIALCADVEVAPDADLEAVQARVLLAAARLLSPPVRFHSLPALLAEGRRVEDIFDGPPLEHGFLLDDELAASQLRAEVQASDLVASMMGVEGVVAVRAFTMAAYDQEGRPRVQEERSRIALPAGSLPRLSPDRCKLTFYRDGIPFGADREETRQKLAFLEHKEGLRQVTRPKGSRLDLEPPTGTWQALDDYRLVQHDLPQVYGVGRDGLPDTAGVTRRAQARQLKAYLLLFEQVLANAQWQAAHVGDLFSLDPAQTRTRFTAPLFERPELRALFQPAGPAAEPPDAGSASAGSASAGPAGSAAEAPDPEGVRDTPAEDLETFEARRNGFLDHLLARFGESFAEYAAVMAGLRSEGWGGGALIDEKLAFLRDYPRQSAERGKAFDQSHPSHPWPSDNVSGFERRLCALLGISSCARRNLAVEYEIYQEQDTDGIDEYRFRLRDGAGKILLSSSTRYMSVEAAHAEIAAVDRHGPRLERYVVLRDTAGRHYFNLVDPTGEVIARRIEYFETEGEARAAIAHVVSVLAGDARGEGLHLVEHLLLRPGPDQDPLPAPSPGPECPPRPEDPDPYSFRATLVLPAWRGRFVDPAFRAFVERTAHREAPAHVHLKICWVDPAQMRAFEAAWLPWVRERTARPPDRDRLARLHGDLVKQLQALRCVYPPATLHDCVEARRENPLVLGRTQLGTLPTREE